jgi:hypothetical protein
VVSNADVYDSNTRVVDRWLFVVGGDRVAGPCELFVTGICVDMTVRLVNVVMRVWSG